MSSSAKRKLLLRRPVALDLGCSCRRRKLAYLFSFSPSKPKTDQYHSAPDRHQHHHPQPHHRFWSYYPFSPSTATTSPFDTSRYPSSTSATTPSPYDVDDPASSPALSDATASWATKPKPPAAKGKLPGATRVSTGAGRRRRVSESVAVVKDSQDPYRDFRDSMLQMILEKEIYAWEDLSELLHRFLALNSLCHHDAILCAFSEICNSFEAAT